MAWNGKTAKMEIYGAEDSKDRYLSAQKVAGGGAWRPGTEIGWHERATKDRYKPPQKDTEAEIYLHRRAAPWNMIIRRGKAVWGVYQLRKNG